MNMLIAQMELTAAGWVTMILSVGFVTALLGWCVYKVIATPDTAEHVHSQADIEPPDVEDEGRHESRRATERAQRD
jgi:hypothetical protein